MILLYHVFMPLFSPATFIIPMMPKPLQQAYSLGAMFQRNSGALGSGTDFVMEDLVEGIAGRLFGGHSVSKLSDKAIDLLMDTRPAKALVNGVYNFTVKTGLVVKEKAFEDYKVIHQQDRQGDLTPKDRAILNHFGLSSPDSFNALSDRGKELIIKIRSGEIDNTQKAMLEEAGFNELQPGERMLIKALGYEDAQYLNDLPESSQHLISRMRTDALTDEDHGLIAEKLNLSDGEKAIFERCGIDPSRLSSQNVQFLGKLRMGSLDNLERRAVMSQLKLSANEKLILKSEFPGEDFSKVRYDQLSQEQRDALTDEANLEYY